MTIYIVDLESIPTRYTCEWRTHLPELLKHQLGDVKVISGPDDLPSDTTPGMFLNFATTNIYKSVQVEKFSRLFSDGEIKDGDYFLFTDAWHPGIINLRYISDLLGIKVKIGGFWHSGNYDLQDGLGQILKDAPWVKHAEQSFFHALDHNYFATDFHIKMFADVYGTKDYVDDWMEHQQFTGKIVRTGWPMEYMRTTLEPYKNIPKRDLILFPHRIAPEKQVDIFRDIQKSLPQYEFIVCQDKKLTKDEYHTLLGATKILFSASKQETLGISPFEGALVGAIPLVPNRLSYSEMYTGEFLYPSVWTTDFNAYLSNKGLLLQTIVNAMDNYDALRKELETNSLQEIENTYFSCTKLINVVKENHRLSTLNQV